MKLPLPIISYLMFPEHARPVKTEKVKSENQIKTTTQTTIRNNTRNILDEKYRMYVEQSAQLPDEEIPVVVVDDEILTMSLLFRKFPDALVRWNLTKSRDSKSISGKKRTKAIKQARKNKQFAMDYQLPETPESDIDDFVLQDLYELYHYNMGELIKYVNSRNK